MVTITMQRSASGTTHDEIILIDKDQISARGRIWQNMSRFTNKLTLAIGRSNSIDLATFTRCLAIFPPRKLSNIKVTSYLYKVRILNHSVRYKLFKIQKKLIKLILTLTR